MIKKLPSTLYVKWDQPAQDEMYLIAAEDLYGLVDSGKKKSRIGTYKLVETTDADLVVRTSKPISVKPKKR